MPRMLAPGIEFSFQLPVSSCKWCVASQPGSLNGQPPTLSGAAVEGPNSAASSGVVTNMLTCPPGGGDTYKKFNGNGAVYKDNVQSYSTDEPAIDLTAASFLMYGVEDSRGTERDAVSGPLKP